MSEHVSTKYDFKKKISSMYRSLFLDYGPQGWWPIKKLAGKNGSDERGYHKGNFSYPKDSNQRFEIAIGAILTQNTNWKNAEKALDALYSQNLVNPKRLVNLDNSKLANLIASAGYYNQKAKKLKEITKWFIENDIKVANLSRNIKKLDEIILNEKILEIRKDLLNVHGVGFETADSILLYSYNLPIFVVDTYTKRLFRKEKIIPNKTLSHKKEYSLIQDLVHSTFSEIPVSKRVEIFNEFHALIVEWGKRNSRRGKKF